MNQTRRFGPFELVSVVSTGGFSDVYRVRDKYGISKIVKVNLHHEEIVAREGVSRNLYELSHISSERRTLEELAILNQLNHPNIIKPVDVLEEFDAEGHWGLVLEDVREAVTLRGFLNYLLELGVFPHPLLAEPVSYLKLLAKYPSILPEGTIGKSGEEFQDFLFSMQELSAKTGNWTPMAAVGSNMAKALSEKLKGFLNQLKSAVDYQVREGVVHNDLSPSNVLIDSMQGVKIIDYGVGYNADSPNGQWGSRMYSPPERYRGEQNPYVDLWSLALIGYEMMTGKHIYTIKESEISSEEIQTRNYNLIQLVPTYYPDTLAFPMSAVDFQNKIAEFLQACYSFRNPILLSTEHAAFPIFPPTPLTDHLVQIFMGLCLNPEQRAQRFSNKFQQLTGLGSDSEEFSKYVLEDHTEFPQYVILRRGINSDA